MRIAVRWRRVRRRDADSRSPSERPYPIYGVLCSDTMILVMESSIAMVVTSGVVPYFVRASG